MTKYIPPHARNFQEKKTENVLEEINFPELIDTKKREKCNLDFASILKGELEDEKKCNVKPGYVRLYFVENKIMKEWGPEDTRYREFKENEGLRQQKIINNMIKRWQNYRDEQNELYSDRSEFWNKASLLDITNDNDSDSDIDNYEEDYLEEISDTDSESEND
jgi:hypothetical protein